MEREERSAARAQLGIPSALSRAPNRTEPVPFILSEPQRDQSGTSHSLVHIHTHTSLLLSGPPREKKMTKRSATYHVRETLNPALNKGVRFNTRLLQLAPARLVPLKNTHFTFRERVLHFLVTHGTSRNAVQSWTLTALLTFHRSHVTHQ